jgi:hypothetical protein
MKKLPMVQTTRNNALSALKVASSSNPKPPRAVLLRSISMTGVNITVPKPTAKTMSPLTRPFLVGYHFWAQAIEMD